MGTNFYLIEAACSHCGRERERLHIGKSSAGWCFTLHVTPVKGIYDLEDWITRWSKPGALIVDEYGRTVPPDTMLKTVTLRSWPLRNRPDSFHRSNDSEPGPHGLLRHRLGRFCVKHGAGTWDCVVGEFG